MTNMTAPAKLLKKALFVGVLCNGFLAVLPLSFTLCPMFILQAALANPTAAHQEQTISPSAKQEFDVSGLPSKQLETMLRSKEPLRVRATLSRIARHENDDDARAAWLAACLSLEGKEEASIAEFAKVKHWENANNFALYLVARAYCSVADFARAREVCTFEIGRGNCWECYDVRGACNEAEKRYVEAAADFEKAATCHPRYANGFYCKAGQAMLKANQPAKALAIVGKAPAIQKNEHDMALLTVQGQCFERLNRNEEAIKSLSRALASNTKKEIESSFLRSSCLLERAKCYEKLGRKAEAAADRSALENTSKGLREDLLGK